MKLAHSFLFNVTHVAQFYRKKKSPPHLFYIFYSCI